MAVHGSTALCSILAAQPSFGLPGAVHDILLSLLLLPVLGSVQDLGVCMRTVRFCSLMLVVTFMWILSHNIHLDTTITQLPL